jgi:hypothetical protein
MKTDVIEKVIRPAGLSNLRFQLGKADDRNLAHLARIFIELWALEDAIQVSGMSLSTSASSMSRRVEKIEALRAEDSRDLKDWWKNSHPALFNRAGSLNVQIRMLQVSCVLPEMGQENLLSGPEGVVVTQGS